MRSLVVSLLFVAGTGCSAVVGSAADSDAQSTSVTGVVVVDRTVADDFTHSEASARFIRLRGAMDDSTLTLVGAGLDLPAIGQCTIKHTATASRSVELLDVGAISIEAQRTGQHINLTSRQVPDVVDLVSGPVYSARVDEGTVPSASDVVVLASGSADVPGFAVHTKTPEAPALVAATALDASSVQLSWTPGSDTIYIDFGANRCSFADDGRAVISSVGLDSETPISIHRVRREKLSIPGLDGGELRFDFARAVTFRH